MWLFWLLLAWVVVATALAVGIGAAIGVADRRARADDLVMDTLLVESPPQTAAPRPAAAPHPARTGPVSARRVPVPPVATALVLGVLLLQATGLGVRLSGAERTLGPWLSMDAPGSLPRLVTAGLFATAAVVAVLGAARQPGRRTWWACLAAVAALVTVVKADGMVHTVLLERLGGYRHPVVTVVVSAVLVVGAVGGLWWLSRHERRDRRRVLAALATWATGATLLSSVSTAAASAGPGWGAVATFGEEVTEGLGGVAFLLAVLLGVVPRAVLPAGWPLRRAADDEVLAPAPSRVPGRPA